MSTPSVASLFVREKMNLQKGMNFRCNPKYSVLLMSTRDGAPFEDEIAADEAAQAIGPIVAFNRE